MNRGNTCLHFRHSEYEQTQHAFRTSGGINLITKVLSTAQHWAVIKAACGLIRNLALNAANIPFFKDTGKFEELVEGDSQRNGTDKKCEASKKAGNFNPRRLSSYFYQCLYFDLKGLQSFRILVGSF